MSKQTRVFQKKFELVQIFETQKEAREFIKETKLNEGITTNKDFRLE